MSSFRFDEKYRNQIPALQTLIKLGYKYIPPSQAFKYRKGNLSNVLLEDILKNQLCKQNRIFYRNKEYAFSDENISRAISKLRRPSLNYVMRGNQEIYDLITLPQSLTQTIQRMTRNFNLFYIDWKNWQNNVYHCTAEYTVKRSRCTKTTRPDIILFVNGIPLAVIECKPPKGDKDRTLPPQLQNQGSDYLPHLFVYEQLLLALNRNQCKHTPLATSENDWMIWKSNDDFRAGRINDLECLPIMLQCSEEMIRKQRGNAPDPLKDDREALSYDISKDLTAANPQNLMACEKARAYLAETTIPEHLK